MIGVVACVIAAAGVASLIPAWRATRVDPATVMLAE
jgi:ABC-type lipoprotein release transport system permease subunit